MSSICCELWRSIFNLFYLCLGPVKSIEKLLDKYITEEEEKTTRLKNKLNNVNINSDFEHTVKTESEETTQEKKKNKKKVLKSKKETSDIDSKTKETIGGETYVETDGENLMVCFFILIMEQGQTSTRIFLGLVVFIIYRAREYNYSYIA